LETRIAAARVYQAVEIEGQDAEEFEESLCEKRRRLWGIGVKCGVKHDIIAIMLDILAGKRKVVDHVVHDAAMVQLSRGLNQMRGYERPLERAYRSRMAEMKALGREDEEGYEVLDVMLKMIADGRRKAEEGIQRIAEGRREKEERYQSDMMRAERMLFGVEGLDY